MGVVCLRFLAFLLVAGDVCPAPSCRRLFFSGVPVLAIAVAARDRIMSVCAAMFMLLSLPASLAGLHVGKSELLAGARFFGVPSASLAFLVLTGVLEQSLADSSWLLSFGVEGEFELCVLMSCSVSVACLTRALAFEGAFEDGAVVCAGAVDEAGEGCSPTFSSFSLFAVTLVVS